MLAAHSQPQPGAEQEDEDVDQRLVKQAVSCLSDIGDASNLAEPVTPAHEIEEPHEELVGAASEIVEQE